MTVRQDVPTARFPAGDHGDPAGAGRPSRAAGATRSATDRSPWALLVIAVMAAALFAVGASFSFAVPGSPWPVVASLLTQALFVTAGLVAWWRRPHNRIGPLMLFTGLSIWLANLVDAPTPFLITIGTALATLPIALTLHLLLAYPSGRVQGRFARALVLVGYGVCTILQTPLYLLGDGPLAIEPDVPAAVVATAAWLQTAVGIASLLGASTIVGLRALRADPVERRQVGPLVWYRVVAPLIIAAGAVVRLTIPDAGSWVGYLQVLALMGLPLAFLVGLLFGSFGRTYEVGELVAQISGATPTGQELTAAVAVALGDPHATVVYARADGRGYVDESGRPVEERPGQVRLSPVVHDGRVVGAISHRTALSADDGFVHVLAGVVAMAIEQRMLTAQHRALVLELRAQDIALRQSRLRLLRAEDTERRRIARDLHDGAQQHIVFLGMSARQLSRLTDDPPTARAAADIADGLAALLTDFRDLVNGIMPAPLVEAGLAAAVRALAERMPVPTRVSMAALPDRLPAEVESTAYFVAAEALTNSAKHAQARSVEVVLGVYVDRLVLTVRDDGIGGADPTDGSGLRRLADRVAALGGRLRVRPGPTGGTEVEAGIPCHETGLTDSDT